MTFPITWPSSRNLDFPCKHWPFVQDFQKSGRLARKWENWSCTWYCKLITAFSSLLNPFGSIYLCLQYGMKTWNCFTTLLELHQPKWARLWISSCCQSWEVNTMCSAAMWIQQISWEVISALVLQHLLGMGSVPVYFLVVTEGNGKSKTVQHQAGQLYTELVPKSCLSDSRQDPAPQCSGSMASLAIK